MAFEDIVYQTAIADGIPRPLALLVVAQSKHESNDYTSPVFLSCNNAFGYGYGEDSCNGHPYRGYNSLADSTHDLTGWVKRRLSEGNFPALDTITTPEQYAQLLFDNGYYTGGADPLGVYSAGLKRWFTDNIGGAIGGGFLILLAMAAFFFYRGRDKHA